MITEDPTSPQIGCYTTLWNITVSFWTLVFHKAVWWYVRCMVGPSFIAVLEMYCWMY